MNLCVHIVVGLLTLVSPAVDVFGLEKTTESKKLVRIGGVAYKPDKVTIFRNLKTLLNREGFAADFVLYSDYDAANDALSRGEVDVVWNAPRHHARFHVTNGGSQSLAMRDVDQDRLTLIVRKESRIKSLKELSGKRLILGDAGHQKGAPAHYLEKEGVDLDGVKVVQMGGASNSVKDVLNALKENRSDGAVILESAWKRAKEFREANPDIAAVWNSSVICHCTFTAAQDFDAKLGSKFTQIITSMDLKDPLVAELNRLEGSKKWLPGNADGFEVLVKAISKEGGATKATRKENRTRPKDVVRLGGVAGPKSVTVFQNLKTYLNRKGFSADFVLYSDHDSAIDAMHRGELDIMWSSPVPHARFHLLAGGSQTLAMRDVDAGLRVTLVARAESEINSLKDLRGKRLVLGSIWNASGTLLPLHYLKKEGADIDKLKIVSLARERDSQGRSAHSSKDVLQALSEGRGDAAVVVEHDWKNATAFRKENPTIKEVWSSPEFCHCTFSAPMDFDLKLGQEFTRLITSMDPNDPLIAELNRLEHTKSWVPGNSKGFEALYEALENKAELLKSTER